MTKRETIIKAKEAYQNAIYFADISQYKPFIRYYGEAQAWIEYLLEEHDTFISETGLQFLQDLENECSRIYLDLEVDLIP